MPLNSAWDALAFRPGHHLAENITPAAKALSLSPWFHGHKCPCSLHAIALLL
jgi:hypothetical protein